LSRCKSLLYVKLVKGKVRKYKILEKVYPANDEPEDPPDLKIEPDYRKGPDAKSGLEIPKVARNALCPCGSGKKYKRCHGA